MFPVREKKSFIHLVYASKIEMPTKVLVRGGYCVVAVLITHFEQFGDGKFHPQHCIHMLA